MVVAINTADVYKNRENENEDYLLTRVGGGC